MSDEQGLDELVERLTRISRLTEREARHLMGEVLAYLNEPLGEFIRRRHLELQRQGLGNAAIYQRISTEVDRRPFRPEPLSERQIRRLIYG